MNYYTRKNPFLSHIKERILLTKPSSTKATYHIALALENSGITYRPGDSVAILPDNDPTEVDLLLQQLNISPNEEVQDSRAGDKLCFIEFLLKRSSILRVTPNLIRALQKKSDHPLLKDLLTNKPLQECYLPREVLGITNLSLTAQELTETLSPLLPRFYSIASSPSLFPQELHLLVTELQYTVNNKQRRGVTTHFLCQRATQQGTSIPLYIQPSPHFSLPPHPETPLIFIGPGTGVAPFRAFLQERLARGHLGKNWLFFGERNRLSDFYYEEFLLSEQQKGTLRLDLAFSRDLPNKIYVQDLMWEHRTELWKWIQEGAHFYVCGDAQNMAKDVETMFQKIACIEGLLSEEAAQQKVRTLRTEKRYLTDVY